MKISPAETHIMDALWRLGRPTPLEDVTAALADQQEWSDGTVRTFLTRLVKKKAVAADRDGRRFLYRPLLARADYVQAESETLLDRLFEGRLVPFVTQFASRKTISPEELADLRRLVERLENDK